MLYKHYEQAADQAIKDQMSQSGDLSYERLRLLGEVILELVSDLESLEDTINKESYEEGVRIGEAGALKDYNDRYEEGYTDGFLAGRKVEATSI